jgi:hypothetical protein
MRVAEMESSDRGVPRVIGLLRQARSNAGPCDSVIRSRAAFTSLVRAPSLRSQISVST